MMATSDCAHFWDGTTSSIIQMIIGWSFTLWQTRRKSTIWDGKPGENPPFEKVLPFEKRGFLTCWRFSEPFGLVNSLLDVIHAVEWVALVKGWLNGQRFSNSGIRGLRPHTNVTYVFVCAYVTYICLYIHISIYVYKCKCICRCIWWVPTDTCTEMYGPDMSSLW